MEIQQSNRFKTSFRVDGDNDIHCYFHLGRVEHGLLLNDIKELRDNLNQVITAAKSHYKCAECGSAVELQKIEIMNPRKELFQCRSCRERIEKENQRQMEEAMGAEFTRDYAV